MQKGISNFVALLGGAEITVSKLDASTEIVKVLQVLGNEPALAALYGGRFIEGRVQPEPDTTWSEQLTRESHEAVIAKGVELNQSFFSRWEERQAKVPKPDPQEAALMLGAVAKANPEFLQTLLKNLGQRPPPEGSEGSAPRPRTS